MFDTQEYQEGNVRLLEQLKDDIKKKLQSKNISEEDVSFVSLDEDYWISLQEFFLLKRLPRSWDRYSFRTEQFGTWRLPYGFRIVMKDFSILRYYQCFDPYYSKWEIIPPARRPLKKYFESRAPTTRTFGDYLNNPKVKKNNQIL